MKITEKLHGQCFWSLTVARGVVLNDHLKMLAIQWGAVHVCDRSVQLESFHLTAYFCKTVYWLSSFMCYCDIICVLVEIILDFDWLMRFKYNYLFPSNWELCHREMNAVRENSEVSLVLHYFSQACMGCSSKLCIILASLVFFSTDKTVLKENTRQCLLDFMWDADYGSWKLHCLRILHKHWIV